MRMNKRGFLLAEETLKIILALISISFLIYFLTALYLSGQESKKLDLAKASLEFLMSEINSEIQSVEIYNPEGWVIVSWSLDKPLSCSNLGYESCICICDDVGLISKGLSSVGLKNKRILQMNVCDQSGVCMDNPNFFVVKGEAIKIEEPPIFIKIEDKILK